MSWSKKSIDVLTIAAMSVLTSGCAYIDQNVKIKPSIFLEEANIGNGREVTVRIVDERDDSLIGKRGSGYGPAAAIKTDQNIADIFLIEILKGLKNKGFRPVPDSSGSLVQLKVEIRSLKYDTSMGLWTFGNIAKSAVKVTVENGDQRYEKMYRSQNEIRTAFVASQETNARIINQAVSEVIEKIFTDKQLLNFLAR